jgi:hypothetical protein
MLGDQAPLQTGQQTAEGIAERSASTSYFSEFEGQLHLVGV